MSYIGIDYSLGRSNFNTATGIHFGVISQHSISGDALGDIESDYGDPNCPKCGNAVVELDEYYKTHPENAEPDDEELKNYTEHGCADYVCDSCKLIFDTQYVTPDEPIGLKYEQEGYKITDCLDSDLFILESPFYTHAQYCSPCVPGAGSLDNPIDGGPKTYCLGHDWFEGEIAPYPVFRVSDGKKIVAKREEQTCQSCNGSGRDTVARLMKVRCVSAEEIIREIRSGQIRVEDLQLGNSPETATYQCWRCDGKGKVEVVNEYEE